MFSTYENAMRVNRKRAMRIARQRGFDRSSIPAIAAYLTEHGLADATPRPPQHASQLFLAVAITGQRRNGTASR